MRIENKQLKDFILDSSLLSEEIVEENFKLATETNKKLGDLLVEKKLMNEIELRKLYSYILGIPFVNLEKELITADILQIIPEPIAKKYGIVAFEKEGNNLKVAMKDPDDIQTIDFIKKKTGLKIIPPPMPINPDIKPIMAPINKANGIFIGCNSFLPFPNMPTNLAIANNKTVPKIILYKWVSTFKNPPKNEKGMEAKANG